jgi:hypothetical protein
MSLQFRYRLRTLRSPARLRRRETIQPSAPHNLRLTDLQSGTVASLNPSRLASVGWVSEALPITSASHSSWINFSRIIQINSSPCPIRRVETVLDRLMKR